MLSALAVAAGTLGALDPRPAAGTGPQVVWVFEPMERGAIISSPLVDGDCIYVTAIRDKGLNPTGVVYCLRAHTGEVLWHFDDAGGMQHGFSSPRLANGLLYVGEGMHANYLSKLYCLEAATGRKRWHFEAAGHVESTPCLARGKVYFGAGDDGLHCLDALTGERCWHFQGPFHVDCSPVVVGQRLYAGSGVSRRHKATEAFCLDADTGHVIWRTPTRLPVWGSPRVAGEQVFFGLGTGRLERSADPGEKPAGALQCLDAATGQSLWNYPVSEGIFGMAAVDDQCVYFGARNGWCHCLDRRSGELRWQVQLGSPIVNDVVLTDGRLYVVPVAGQASCLNAATGDVLWSWDVAAVSQSRPRIYSSPTVVSFQEGEATVRRIYVGTELRSPISSTAVLYCIQD
jgi:outer membrane protein assembly factor BamB